MEEIKFSDFKIIPDFNSVHKENVDDDQYFGDRFKKYISNSRLGLINPEQNGSPLLFKQNPKKQAACLSMGSCIHQCVLEKDSYFLAPKIGKPSSKLGLVFDEIDKLNATNKNQSLNDIITQASLNIDYYTKTIDKKIDGIKEQYLDYKEKADKIIENGDGRTPLILSDNDWNIANACINSLNNNKVVQQVLFPVDEFGDKYTECYCEDALFIDFVVTYKEHQCAIIPFKLKIDNWNINTDKKIVSLNDIKTTGKSTNKFMEPGGSFEHYRYYRQLGVYLSILEMYLNKECGISTKNGWKFETNICAVETIPNYWSTCFKINNEMLHKGIVEFTELMKRVAYCEIAGYDAEVKFI